jgi:site-specific recombinase XerD
MAKRKDYKRANGEGSVYKLQGRRRRPWIARITVGWDEDTGKQLYQTLGYFEKLEEAKDAINRHKFEPVSPKATISLKGLYNEWAEPKYKYISKSTSDGYKAAWKYIGVLGEEKFNELRAGHYQKIIDECFEKGMSRSTLEKIKAVCTMLYGYALENDIAKKNYAEFIRLPKVDKEEKEIFSDLDIKKLQDNDTVMWIDTILIMIYTGMRISEMLQLTKFDVDIENRVITGGVKTDAGKNRIIPIHDKIFPYVEKWYKMNNNYLITKGKGQKISADYYRKSLYYNALNAIGIRELSPHACRHTFASLMAKAGADNLSIQKIIGHSDYSFTANNYTHTDISELRKAINLL